MLVTKSGQVQNRLLHPATPLSGEELERIHNYLHERLSGLTLSDVRRRIAQELASERVQYSELEKKALEMSRAVLPREDVSEVIIEGSSRLIEQTMQGEVDVEKMRHLLHALEEKQRLIELLEQTEQAQGLKVFIGNEAQLGEVSDPVDGGPRPYGSEERAPRDAGGDRADAHELQQDHRARRLHLPRPVEPPGGSVTSPDSWLLPASPPGHTL